LSGIKDLKIKIFADGANIPDIKKAYEQGIVKGFTTNPTLMKKAGVWNYESFAKEVLEEIPDMPISFEVFSDDFEDMERQARKISSWGKNVYVKIPITNTKGESSIPLIRRLAGDGMALNVTAILTPGQAFSVIDNIPVGVKGIVSVFAGRIADTGRDPWPCMMSCSIMIEYKPDLELLWASTRELLNIYQAEQCGCHIVTVTNDILNKLTNVNMDLEKLSLSTVNMFYSDAQLAGYSL
jgi:transaldolase